MFKKKTVSIIFNVIVISLFLSCSSDDEITTTNNTGSGTIEYDFSDRSYIINSEGTGNSTPSPLLIVLHGASSTGGQMVIGTKFNEIADGSGYIIVYPNAHLGLWNFGKECNPVYPDRPDDIEFIKYLIEKISQEFNVDENRIYVTGFSMGGFFSFYLARHLSDKIAAFAPVAATMPRFVTNGTNIRPIPMLLTASTNDFSVPYEGSGTGNCASMSAPESIEFWARLSECDSNPTITHLPDNGINDLSIRIETFNGCDSKNDAVFVVLEGGGHNWLINEEVNVSQIILDFFDDKSL